MIHMMKTITISNLEQLENWFDNMREAIVAQIQRGSSATVKVSSRPNSPPRIVDWQISLRVRNESGNEVDELMALA